MICVDTMVLIWGVQGVARSAQQHMVDRTRRYLDSLEQERTIIMVPTVVAAEYLQGFEGHTRQEQLAALEKYFFVPSFDLPSAFLAAELARRRTVADLASTIDRQTVKADTQIVATAIVHRAERIITANVDEFSKIAGGRIVITGIPEIHEQTNLLED